MNTILDYLTIDILTMYENNIKQHYIEYVERYVNVVWERKFMIKNVSGESLALSKTPKIIKIA